METIKNISTALVKAQAEMSNPKKGSSNPFFKSKYADLNSVREAVLPILNAHGITVLQPIVHIEGKNFIKTILLHSIMPEQVIFASLAGASAVGVLGIYFAHRVHTPPIVFTIPAVINMIPGIYGYEFIIGLIQIVSHGKENQFNFTYVMEIFSYGLKAGFIMLALAFGIIVPLLISNAKTTKDTPDVHRVIRNQVIPKVKIIRRSRRRK